MKKSKINLKRAVTIVFLSGFYLFFIFVLVEFSRTRTIIIGNNTIWNIANGKWENIEYKSSMDYQPYQVLIDKKEVGEYKLKLDKGIWELYNKQNELSRQYGEVFAYQSKDKVTLDSGIENVTEVDTAMTKVVLEGIGIDTKEMSFVNESKLVMDIDGDGVDEVVVSAINTNYDELFGSQAVSIVYFLKDGNPKILLYDAPSETYLATKAYSIYGTLQFGSGKVKTLIIAQNTFGERIPSCHYAFDITKNEMMLVSSCQNEVEQ